MALKVQMMMVVVIVMMVMVVVVISLVMAAMAMVLVVVTVVATKGNIKLNVGSKAQWGVWCPQNSQSLSFVIIEGWG
jgi:hypothetical protein